MAKKYIVRLSQEERAQLIALISKGRASAQKIKHANVLLKVDASVVSLLDPQTTAKIRRHSSTGESEIGWFKAVGG